MKFVLFREEDEDGISQSFFPEHNVKEFIEQGLLPDKDPIWSVEADTWREAMQAYYDFMDWGTYNPPSNAPVDDLLDQDPVGENNGSL